MARSYANIVTSIWNNEDFCARSAGAQRTYFMLLTQTDISAAGTLAYTVRRWSLTLPQQERAHLPEWLAELAEHSYVVIDEDTEELLVRKFIKWDNSYTNPRRTPSIESAAKAIRSVKLRSVMATELAKLGLPEWLTVCQRDSHRVVVKEGDYVGEPRTTTRERGPTASDDAEPPSMFCPKHPNGTTESCGPCGTARKQFDRWHDADARRAEQGRMAARAAIRDCTFCDNAGMVLDPDTNLPTAVCGHRSQATA